MNSSIKRTLTCIGNIKYFESIFNKLIIGESLDNDEKVYILTCAMLFEKEYTKDRRHKSFIEIAYYIVLKYSLQYEDYEPLYDLSLNFGFYPISNFIINNNLIEFECIENFLKSRNINLFKNPLEHFIETHEQYITRNELLGDDSEEISYIAPTSYGKSSIIKEHIRNNNFHKIGIIVPSKSLLNQTYRLIKNEDLGYRLILHDDMYSNDDRFIGILTQERALRLIEKHNIHFEVLYIDEAHNLFQKDNRSILLYRLIAQNKSRNPNQKLLYLSPLIADGNNLKLNEEKDISEHKIEYNIKEPEYFEYKLDKTITQYNRFTNKFYPIAKANSFIEYIIENSTNKTFVFHNRPVKTERFSKQLADNLYEIVTSDNISPLIEILTKYVHKDFYMIELIKKGIIYLHAKLPDQIKDYLEYHYKINPELKYVVANSVILEGINLPISSMFLLNVRGLNEKKLTNLIGRVNRLNNIFDEEKGNLNLLLPKIHFVNSQEYYNKSMENKIRELRSREFSDYIENPLLYSYNIDNIDINYDKNKGETKESKKEKMLEDNAMLLKRELWLVNNPINEEERLAQAMFKSGVASFYNMSKCFVRKVLGRIIKAKTSSCWNDKDIITKLYEIFIKDFNNIIDYEVERLSSEPARNYYKTFIDNSKKSLNEIINGQMKYFKVIQKDNSKNTFYFGSAYGEVAKDSKHYPNSNRNAYINLNEKNDKEIVNLVIVKIKMEEDFVSFKLNNFFNLMLNEIIITPDEYNMVIYGTTDEKKITLTKIGLPMNIINLFQGDKQLDNIGTDMNNNFIVNDEFKAYKETLDDFLQFRIDKFL